MKTVAPEAPRPALADAGATLERQRAEQAAGLVEARAEPEERLDAPPPEREFAPKAAALAEPPA
jgi:hypothetical protein